MGKQWKLWQTIFLGSKITADGDCLHEIKWHLLLEKKAMTNLDSILKSRDISLLTKVCVVKAMVFPVVMYRCDSWTVKKKTERQIIDAFGLWCWRILLKTPLDCKEISPEYSLEGLMLKLKLQYFGHLMWRAHWLEKTLILGKIKGRRRREWPRMRWLIQLDGDEFEQALGDGEGQGSLACWSPWGHKQLDMTDWTTTAVLYCLYTVSLLRLKKFRWNRVVCRVKLSSLPVWLSFCNLLFLDILTFSVELIDELDVLGIREL